MALVLLEAQMSTQLETLKALSRQASGPTKPALMHLIADWTTFVAWLHTELGEYADQQKHGLAGGVPAGHLTARSLRWTNPP